MGEHALYAGGNREDSSRTQRSFASTPAARPPSPTTMPCRDSTTSRACGVALLLSVIFNPIVPGNGATAFLWDFGDGETSHQMFPTHVYTTPGIYDVTLTVTINGSQIALTETQMIEVGRTIVSMNRVEHIASEDYLAIHDVNTLPQENPTTVSAVDEITIYPETVLGGGASITISTQ